MPSGIGKELRRCRVPSTMASDLVEFSARPLCQNQECKEARHDSRMDRAEAASSTEQAIYNCVSSAYCCSDKPYCEAMSAIPERCRDRTRSDPEQIPGYASTAVSYRREGIANADGMSST